MTGEIDFVTTVAGTTFRLPDVVSRTLQAMSGKKVRVRISLETNRRPNKRRYYFGVVVRNVCLALREAGNSMDEEETHQMLKQEVGKLRKVVILPTGEIKYTLRSYMDLTPKEESDYVTKCVAWCVEMQIDVPPPDQFHDSQPTKEPTP